MNLQTLVNILKPINNINQPYIVISDIKGNLIDKKMVADVKTNEEFYWYIGESYFPNHHKLIHIQNHIPRYIGNLYIGTSFANDEIVVAEINKWGLNIVIDNKYVYQLKVPKTSNFGGKLNEMYEFSNTNVRDKWRQMVLYGNITLKHYLENVSNAVLEDLTKRVGWFYRRIEHGFNSDTIRRVIIPPREMPMWLYEDEKRGWLIINENANRWKILMREYPYLRKYNF